MLYFQRMQNPDNKILADLLEEYFAKNKIKSVRAFIELYKEKYNDDTLSPNAVYAILKKDSRRKPNSITLAKIAQMLTGNPAASAEDLRKMKPPPDQSDEAGQKLLIGTGFTNWSSYILSLIQEQGNESDKESIFNEGIKFTFCSKAPGEEPFWIDSVEKIEELRTNKTANPHKYIADDLATLLDEGKLDCAFLLRRTFDSLKFKNLKEERPILVSRILVGNGTHMYVIQRERNNETGSFKKPGEERGPIENAYIPIKNADDIVKAKEKFIGLVSNKKVRTVCMGNETIYKDRRIFVGEKKIGNALQKEIYSEIKGIGDERYFTLIKKIKDEFENGDIDILIVLSFAPFNNIIYHDVTSQVEKFRLMYYNFNLSKMVEDKSSYNLYASRSTLRKISKLKKIRTFLKALDEHVSSATERFTNTGGLVTDISQKLSDLYYPDNKFDRNDPNEDPNRTAENYSKIIRMQDDLQDLEYSNQSLPLFDFLVSQIENR